MGTLRATIEIENRINKILSDRENELAELEEKIQEDQKAIGHASLAMEEATAAGDLKAYQAAKSKRTDAEDAKEMHMNRLDALKNKPLISRREYEKAVSDITLEVAALDDETKQALARLSEQMADHAEELRENTIHADEVLRRLQHDVYRDADRTRHNGVILELDAENKYIRRTGTIEWGKCGISHGVYNDYVKGSR